MNDLQEDKATKRRSSTSPGRTFSAALGALVLLLMLTAQAAPAKAGETLIDGLAWRALTDTAGAGLSWSDVATVCPLNETPCKGSVNGIDFTGWTWASKSRVEAMLYQLTGWSIGDSGPYYGSTLDLFFDQFAPVKETDGVKLSHAIYALPEIPGDAMVGAIWIIDAKVPAGTDAIDEQPIDVTATEAGGTFFGGQPIGVFLVRDPALEICNNGIDDNGDGLADIDDEACTALNPVINGREWRQLTVTQGMAFWDVAAVCPAGGLPCSGSVGNVNFDGWIWANSVEVYYMFQALTGYGAFESIPADPTVVPKVFDKFSPTASLATADILFGNTYDSIRSESPSRSGDFWYAFSAINNGVEDFGDPLTCRNGLDDNLNGSVDFADPACYSSRIFSVVDYFDDDPLEDFITTAPGPNIGDTYTPNPFHGYFLSREPRLATRESCDNTFDDDGDGLIDRADDDCATYEPPVGLLVRCIHEPLWPQDNEPITIHAEAIDKNGADLIADRVEIYVNDTSNPVAALDTTSGLQTSTVASGRSLHYGCRAELGDEATFSGWRDVDVGEPEMGGYRAVPVVYNGPVKEKLDLVFIPEINRHSGTAGWALFQSDIYQVVREGLLEIPWFVKHQSEINIWLGRDFATVTPKDANNASSKCKKDKPAVYPNGYEFSDATGTIHDRECRDNSSMDFFTTKFKLDRLQVVAHEIGHAAFSLSDEYQGEPSLYFTLPDFPNLLTSENACKNAAQRRDKDPNACRYLSEARGVFLLNATWIFEPDYRTTSPPTPDLMQQSGSGSCSSADSCAQYGVGPSEIDRMEWKINKCKAGRC
ncbi:hypothetical protein E2F43_18485 [Seongchinamella unica]|uniref:Uncharacterized protein n=1 Tax=Seongchinamella unica TaxID=2547392 RepID=A0A4R5LMT4_9GAMM|nr:hypothetical protein [Seongchinamella unica]TDG11375.1 hypothetical protein E2F43_18485 [Seongchinamella unica]